MSPGSPAAGGGPCPLVHMQQEASPSLSLLSWTLYIEVLETDVIIVSWNLSDRAHCGIRTLSIFCCGRELTGLRLALPQHGIILQRLSPSLKTTGPRGCGGGARGENQEEREVNQS
uniref:Uncharacterized protein n=1 Tax=Knipowitschia caucasica TaxID=637954 RepID=A0AAV2L045_KNICA